MQFNDETNYSGIVQHIDFLLFGNGKVLNMAYAIEDRTRNVNLTLDETVALLFKADPNFMWDDTTNTDFPIATLDLTSGQDHFTIPDSSLKVNRFRIKDRNGKWVTLTPKLRRELTDTDLESTGTPDKYYKMDNAFFPIPVPDYGVSGGIELEFQRGANHFVAADTTKEPGFASIFHEALSIGAALRYAIANDMDKKVAMLTNMKVAMDKKIVEHYETRSPDERPRLRLKMPSVRSYGL